VISQPKDATAQEDGMVLIVQVSTVMQNSIAMVESVQDLILVIVLEHLELDLLVLILHVEQLFVKAIRHVLYQTILVTVQLHFLDSLDQLVVTSHVLYLANMDQHVLDLIYVTAQIVEDFLEISAVIFRVLQDVIMVELVAHLIVVLA